MGKKGVGAGEEVTDSHRPLVTLNKPKRWRIVRTYYDPALDFIIKVYEPGAAEGSVKIRGLL